EIDLELYRRAVAAELADLVAERKPAGLYRMLTYHLEQTDRYGRPLGENGRTGKRLRPTLCLLGWAAVGGDPARAVPRAAAAELDERAYLDLIGRKTGALIACSVEVGAVVGGGDERQVQVLAEYGRLVGRAYQMQDDLLGIWGDQAVTGKPAGDDLRARKQTL